jgi:hypothetical protein
MARSQGSGRVRYRLQCRHTVRTRISAIITIGPNLTGLRGAQHTGSINYTLVNNIEVFVVEIYDGTLCRTPYMDEHDSCHSRR